MKPNLLFVLIFLILISGFYASSSQAVSFKEAINEAAEYFTKSAIKIEPGQELYVEEVINFHSKKHDEEGKRIETELFFALERQFSDFKLFLGPGKGKESEMYLSGTYEQKGDLTEIKLVITKKGEVLGQTEVVFENQKSRRKTLVAVLDLEAETLTASQRKASSDIFRSALSQYEAFDIASSADVDKANPDEIPAATGCTRDSCATIIGEQLGVDRVISSSMYQVSENLLVLSGKIMDIKEGSLLVSKTIRHNGKIDDLPIVLEQLAVQLVGEKEKIKPAKIQEEPKETAVPTEAIEPAGRGPSWIWHLSAIGISALAAMSSMEAVKKYNDTATRNEALQTEYKNSVLVTEQKAIEVEFAENQEKMKEYDSNIALFNAVIALGLVWETYLLYAYFTASDEPETEAHWLSPDHIFFSPVITDQAFAPQFQLTWQW